MSLLSCAKCRTKNNDRFKLYKLNMMKTTFYINMQILEIKNQYLAYKHIQYNHPNIYKMNFFFNKIISKQKKIVL